MIERATKVFGAAFALTMISGAAMAVSPVRVPEPASIAMFAAGGIGAAGIYIVRKWTRRK